MPFKRSLVLSLCQLAVHFLAHEPQVALRMVWGVVVIRDKVELGKKVQQPQSLTKSTLAPHHGLLVLAGRNIEVHHCVVCIPAYWSIKVPRVLDERHALFQKDHTCMEGNQHRNR